MNNNENNHTRLSDLILSALELALEQKDLQVSEQLNKALEISFTRNSGGGEFVERRTYPHTVEAIMERLIALRAAKSSSE